MNKALIEDLAALVEKAAPESLLMIDNDHHRSECPNALFETARVLEQPGDWRALESLERAELAVTLGEFAAMDRTVAETFLGRLRDLKSRRLLCALPSAGTFGKTDMIALGLTELQRYRDPDWTLYEFNIHSYKQVPDWLNSRFWANPELWGKYRW
ncbi:MAG: DUF6231 family protein [Pseudomonadota bacterium]